MSPKPSTSDTKSANTAQTDTCQPETHEPLQFRSDPGASRSTWIAGVLVLLIIGWMGSGFILPSEEETVSTKREDPKPMAVTVLTSTAKPVQQFYQAEGQALPDRDTMLHAEVSGDIAEVFVSKGQDLRSGDIIARFDSASNEADVNRATQDLALAKREYENAQQLLKRGVATEDRVTQARAALASAQSKLIDVEQESKSLTLTAPFDGRLEMLDFSEGEFVSAGAAVARLVDITPLTIAIQVPQQSLTRLKVGQTATVKFITGEERTGTLKFIGTSAASETRTFLAEVEVENENREIPAGISAEVIIPTGETIAHLVPPSIISLNTEGTLGIKTVTNDNVVAFFPITVVKPQIDGIWVTGLPENADIITIGQGFVNEGETVVPNTDEVAE